MVKTKWATISLPVDILNELDDFLLTKDAKKHGYTSKAQIVSLLLRKFLNHELNPFENKFNDEMEEMRRIKKEIEVMKEEVKIENKTGDNIFNSITELTEGKFEEAKNLSLSISKNGNPIVNDPSLKQQIEINTKNEMPYCPYHKAHFCYHISFFSMRYVALGFEALKEKYDTKNN